MALQTDGKIVAAGSVYSPTDFAVVRYNANGSLDTSFGAGGIVTTDLGSPDDYAFGLAIQPSDGKIVVVGWTVTGTGSWDFGVVRYNVNGSIDTSFGDNANGIVTIDFTLRGSRVPSYDYANAVAIQSDGKIVVAGKANNNFAMARLTTSGSLDNSFGSHGEVITQFPGVTSQALAVTIQPTDGKIVLAGMTGPGTAAQAMALARYKTNGMLDTSFHGNGEETLGSLGLTAAYSVAMQGSNIVVAGEGSVGGGTGQAAVVRLNTYGSLDSSFASGGILMTSLGGDGEAAFTSVAIQSNGQIVVAGFTKDDTTGTLITRVATARVNTDGSMDSFFGTNGVVLTTFGGTGANVSAKAAVLIQPDGNIVVGGSMGGDFALERYFGS
jgi:uncharacterized delta-60 repeat protein